MSPVIADTPVTATRLRSACWLNTYLGTWNLVPTGAGFPYRGASHVGSNINTWEGRDKKRTNSNLSIPHFRYLQLIDWSDLADSSCLWK